MQPEVVRWVSRDLIFFGQQDWREGMAVYAVQVGIDAISIAVGVVGRPWSYDTSMAEGWMRWSSIVYGL